MLVHGMGRTGSSLATEAETLAQGGARVVVPDRRGYGESAALEGYAATSVPEQGEDLASLLRALDAGPAVLAGRDFGALACLDVLLRNPGLVLGAVLEDPPLLSLVPEATDVLGAERIALEEKIREGGPRAAMEAWLGEPTEAEPAAFFADFGGLATLHVTRRELRAVARPVALVASAHAEGVTRAAIAALERVLPDVRSATNLGAGVAMVSAGPAPPPA